MPYLVHHALWLARARRLRDASLDASPVRSCEMRPSRNASEDTILWIVGGVFILTVVLAASTAAAAPLRPTAIQRGATGVVTREISAPKVPKGFPACEDPLEISGDLPRTLGETIRYVVEVDGVSIGQIDFRVEREGVVEGQPVTEYRSLFELDALVASVIPVKGQAAALVPNRRVAPIRAMNRYTLRKDRFEESLSFSAGAASVQSKRLKNGKEKQVERSFSEPVRDFISGFYMMRSLPREVKGCTIIYANQRAYTIWLEHQGEDSVQTPVGVKRADKYSVRYANERSKKALSGTIWMSQDRARLPYRMLLDGKHSLDANIHLYRAR